MSSSASESTVHGVEVPEFFRAGVPAIVLSIVAILFIGISAHSIFIVQPGILQRYRDICERNLQALEQEKESPTPEGLRFETREVIDSKEVAGERRRLLEQTHFCLRRLTMSDNKDDALRFQSAKVSDQLADWYLDQARSVFQEEPNKENIQEIIARSQVERKKAIEAMRAVVRLNGPFADRASLWLARRQFFDNLELPTAELETIADQAAKVVERLRDSTAVDSSKAGSDGDSANSAVRIFALQLLREIRVLQAHSCRNEISITQRMAYLREADSLISSSSDTAIEPLAWAAEAMWANNVEFASEVANKALQSFWSGREKGTLSPDSLAAVFRCLLLINSHKEAQIFLSDQLQQITAVDQSRFRSLSAAAALRHLVSMAILEDRTLRTIRKNSSSDAAIVKIGADGATVTTVDRGLPPTARAPGGAAELSAVLSMAVQLNPESLELLRLMERFAKASVEDELIVSLMSAMGLGGDAGAAGAADGNRSVPATLDVGVKSFLMAVGGLGAGALDKPAEDALVTALKTSPAYGVVASRLVMRLNVSEAVDSELAIRWLKAINDGAPEVLVAWSDRANLHLKDKQFQEAIACYEFLLEKLPGSVQLNEALETAKKQLQIGN